MSSAPYQAQELAAPDHEKDIQNIKNWLQMLDPKKGGLEATSCIVPH